MSFLLLEGHFRVAGHMSRRGGRCAPGAESRLAVSRWTSAVFGTICRMLGRAVEQRHRFDASR